MSDAEEDAAAEVDDDFDAYATEEAAAAAGARPPDSSEDEDEDGDEDGSGSGSGSEAEEEPGAAPPDEAAVVLLVAPENHMTSDFLSLSELANVLAVRAAQIAAHSNVILPPGTVAASHDPVELAKQELRAGMCPLVVRRLVSHSGPPCVEERAVRTLTLPADF